MNTNLHHCNEIEIFEPNQTFDFKTVSLATPTLSSGGNYFIKYHMPNVDSLYIQPPKCTTKQGFVKTNGGKRMYCDLVFSNTNDVFIKWIEDLEKYSQEYIFKNRDKWFESQLEMEDIESSFASSLKIYKSGKFYILRTIVPTRLGKCELKIFNEDETEFSIEDFKETTNVITILEIQGIRCSSKSFQIDIEIKQMMVLKPTVFFDKCIIKSSVSQPSGLVESAEPFSLVNTTPAVEKNTEVLDTSTPITKDGVNSPHETEQKQHFHEDHIEIESIPGPDEKDELTEIEFDLEKITIEEDTPPLNLKNRNEVYKNMYERAVEKAKETRNLAIYSYLEAKRIKNLYLLENNNI
jgi:hypothetical protein